MASRKLSRQFGKIKGKIRKIFHRKVIKKIGLGIGLFICAAAVGFFSFSLIYQNRILPHTYIGVVNFGGQDRTQATETLNHLIDTNGQGELSYNWQDKTYSIATSKLAVDYGKDASATINDLLGVGRKGTLGKILKENLRAIFFASNKIDAQFEFKSSELDDYLNNLANIINIPEKDATINIKSPDDLEVVPEQIGRQFVMDENKKISLSSIGSFNFGQQNFRVTNVNPKINAETARQAIPATKTLLSHETTLKAGDKTYDLKSADITQLIDFTAAQKSNQPSPKSGSQIVYELKPQITAEKLKTLLDKIASEVNHDPKDAKFQVVDGKVSAFQISEKGYQLDRDQATEQIIAALENGNPTEVTLIVKETDPAIDSSDPAQSGITELVGEGTTSWRGSPANRIHNLTLGTQKISGTIVKPGEEFSTIKTIGAVDASTGFLPELVIKNSTQVVPEYGGGLCQVSTTLFRAVLHAGLKVTDRTPHSFRVSYYEPPVGMDATIYDPAPDFKFVNNYSTSILIWGIATDNGLDFQIYGTKDSRQIDISDPVVGNYVSPGSPIYTQSDSMAAGDIRQVERATPGATASFHYKVTDAQGTVLQDETFISQYVALPDSYLYGPGTEGIPTQAVEGASIEATPTPAPTPTPTVKGTSKK